MHVIHSRQKLTYAVQDTSSAVSENSNWIFEMQVLIHNTVLARNS